MSEVELWTTKLVELGARIAHLLAADAEVYVANAVREAFVSAPTFAAGLDDAALGALKSAARAAAEGAGKQVAAALPADAWRGVAGKAPDDVRAIPAVAAALAALESTAREFFGEHGLPGEPPPYQLPARFIDGENLVTLTRALWKAVAQRDAALQARASEAAQSSAEARRQRWDDA